MKVYITSPQWRGFPPIPKGHLSSWEWRGYSPIRGRHLSTSNLRGFAQIREVACSSMSGNFLELKLAPWLPIAL